MWSVFFFVISSLLCGHSQDRLIFCICFSLPTKSWLYGQPRTSRMQRNFSTKLWNVDLWLHFQAEFAKENRIMLLATFKVSFLVFFLGILTCDSFKNAFRNISVGGRQNFWELSERRQSFVMTSKTH